MVKNHSIIFLNKIFVGIGNHLKLNIANKSHKIPCPGYHENCSSSGMVKWNLFLTLISESSWKINFTHFPSSREHEKCMSVPEFSSTTTKKAEILWLISKSYLTVLTPLKFVLDYVTNGHNAWELILQPVGQCSIEFS